MKKEILLDSWKNTAFALISGLVLSHNMLLGLGPQPGDIYRVYNLNLKVKNNWRVTDPNASNPGARQFLPNPVLNINIDDLEGAVRAEVIIDRWGGHPGTSEKKIRFNGQDWLNLPELTTTPEGDTPECYMYQDNPILEVPLQHLVEGPNTLEGTCSDQVCFSFDWGQWGWYGIILFIYYHNAKPHPMGRIVYPLEGEKFGDYPTIKVKTSSRTGISRIDFLAHYEGFDVDGDGVFLEWQRYYQGTSLTNHVGSVLAEPWEVTWNTKWIPDQQAGAVKLIARIRDNTGIWFVTDAVHNLSLVRDTVSVKMYKSHSVPQKFWLRDNRKMSCKVSIPESESLDQATEATIHLRTWNGLEEKFALNASYTSPIEGNDHLFKYSIREMPVSPLVNGENRVFFTSATKHHGTEILWPGPAIMVRYKVLE